MNLSRYENEEPICKTLERHGGLHWEIFLEFRRLLRVSSLGSRVSRQHYQMKCCGTAFVFFHVRESMNQNDTCFAREREREIKVNGKKLISTRNYLVAFRDFIVLRYIVLCMSD